jgi:hypothetical protein
MYHITTSVCESSLITAIKLFAPLIRACFWLDPRKGTPIIPAIEISSISYWQVVYGAMVQSNAIRIYLILGAAQQVEHYITNPTK